MYGNSVCVKGYANELKKEEFHSYLHCTPFTCKLNFLMWLYFCSFHQGQFACLSALNTLLLSIMWQGERHDSLDLLFKDSASSVPFYHYQCSYD